MKTADEIRAALALMAAFFQTERGRGVARDTYVQAVGMMTAMAWILGEERIDLPGYQNPIPAMLQMMKEET